MNARIFWIWFAVGAALAVLNTRLMLGDLPFPSLVLGALSTPGVVLALPILNLVASPWWAVGSICILNGTVYGLAARLIARAMRKRRSAAR